MYSCLLCNTLAFNKNKTDVNNFYNSHQPQFFMLNLSCHILFASCPVFSKQTKKWLNKIEIVIVKILLKYIKMNTKLTSVTQVFK